MTLKRRDQLTDFCISFDSQKFPFQIASSQAANQKSSGFCVFRLRFQTDFDELIFSRSTKSVSRKNPTTIGLQAVTTLFGKETESEYIYSKGNCSLFPMPCLAKSYNESIVSYSTWKVGVTFFNHPVWWKWRFYSGILWVQNTLHPLAKYRGCSCIHCTHGSYAYVIKHFVVRNAKI